MRPQAVSPQFSVPSDTRSPFDHQAESRILPLVSHIVVAVWMSVDLGGKKESTCSPFFAASILGELIMSGKPQISGRLIAAARGLTASVRQSSPLPPDC